MNRERGDLQDSQEIIRPRQNRGRAALQGPRESLNLDEGFSPRAGRTPIPARIGPLRTSQSLTRRASGRSYSFGATYSFGLADPSPKKNMSSCFTITS